MIDEKGMMFALILILVLQAIIVGLIIFSIKRLSKKGKTVSDSKVNAMNSIYVVIIMFCVLFLLNSYINLIFIALTTIIVGIIGYIYNYKNKTNKYFIFNAIVYTLVLIYGIFALFHCIKYGI